MGGLTERNVESWENPCKFCLFNSKVYIKEIDDYLCEGILNPEGCPMAEEYELPEEDI